MANKKVSQLTSKPSVLVTDLFPIADPSTGQLYKTTISDLGTAIGSGVSSVNGLVGAVVLDTDDIQELVSPTNKWFTDTRARAALSASSPLAYNSGTGVFSIPAATSSQNGYLTSTDWTTFNSKQAALSGTGFVKISGTTISYDNSTYTVNGGFIAGQLIFAQNTTSLAGSTSLSWDNTNGYLKLGLAIVSTAKLQVGGNAEASSFIKTGGTSSQFLKADGTVDSNTYLTTSSASSTYLPLSGGTMTGQIVLKEASSSTDYTKGLKFPDNPFGGGGDVSGLRLYADTSVGTEAQVLELYIGNDSEVAVSKDRINFATGVGITPDNNLVTINGNIIWNAGNLTPQTQLNGTGFVKASGTTITYDNSTYLTTSSAASTYLAKTGGTLTGGLSGTTAGFTGQISTGNGADADILINVTSAGAGTKYASLQSSVSGLSLVLNHTNGGKIGVGTTSPNHLFTLSATASNKTEIGLYNTFNDANNRNWAMATNQVAFGDFHLMQSNAKDGNPTSSGTSRLMINSSGYIGIGSTSPTLAKVVIEKSGSLFPGLMINNTTSDEATIRFKSTHSANSDYKIGASIKTDSAFEIYSVNADATRLTISSGGWSKFTSNDGSGTMVVYNSGLSSSNYMMFMGGGAQVNGIATGANGAATLMTINRDSGSLRSINAAGTLNALGADYAEYMYKSNYNTIINKADIIGIDKNGLITDIYTESVSFAIKSTNPSYVGNDTWGNEDIVGKMPMEDDFETKEKYHIALNSFKSKVEIERAKVDRVAFSGQVPCNVLNAKVGDYIIPVNDNGKIKGIAVSNPTFEQYQISVGKVWKIMEDGRAWVAVKIG